MWMGSADVILQSDTEDNVKDIYISDSENEDDCNYAPSASFNTDESKDESTECMSSTDNVSCVTPISQNTGCMSSKNDIKDDISCVTLVSQYTFNRNNFSTIGRREASYTNGLITSSTIIDRTTTVMDNPLSHGVPDNCDCNNINAHSPAQLKDSSHTNIPAQPWCVIQRGETNKKKALTTRELLWNCAHLFYIICKTIFYQANTVIFESVPKWPNPSSCCSHFSQGTHTVSAPERVYIVTTRLANKKDLSRALTVSAEKWVPGSVPDHHKWVPGSVPDHHKWVPGSAPDHHKWVPGSAQDNHKWVPGSIQGNHRWSLGSFIVSKMKSLTKPKPPW